MPDASQIRGTSSTPPAEDQWLRFVEKLTSSPILWLQLVDKLTSSTPGTAVRWLEFVAKLVRNPPQHPEFDKILVLTRHYYEVERYAVYMIDLNSASNIHKYSPPSLSPVIKFHDLHCHDAFVILGCKLYMFAGWFFDINGIKWVKNVSIYDMRKALSSGTTFDFATEEDEEEEEWLDSLETGPEMAIGKRWPIAVVIDKFNICVFSTLLYEKKEKPELYGPGQLSFLSPNFELYDTRKGSWIALHEPLDCNKFEPKVSVYVHSYCVYGSSLIIQTTLGIYGINLDNPKSEWVKMDGSEPIQKFPYKGMWTLVAEKTLYARNVRPSFTALKESTDRESLIERCETGVLCLGGVKNGCINLCSVRGGLPFEDDIPNLLVDIVKFDAEALRILGSDFSRWKEIRGDKSFNFSLTPTPSKQIDVLGCFPLKDYIWQDTEELKDIGLQCVDFTKELKDIGLHWVDFANKVVALESRAHSLDFSTSHTEGAKGNGYFRRPHQAEFRRTVAYGHAVGLPSRLQRILWHLFVQGFLSFCHLT